MSIQESVMDDPSLACIFVWSYYPIIPCISLSIKKHQIEKNMNLPTYLFWDIDLDTLDKKQNARFIIHRVIQRGSLEDWKTIKSFYGIKKLKEEITQIRDLDPKSLTFFSIYFAIPKVDFRCFTTQQYSQKHFSY